MIKLKKVYLDNFKGISSKHIIDFDSDSVIMMGPNGFGKTTIFDAIELCLTKNLHRTEKKRGITRDTRDYFKPFFQNKADKDVTIKVWFTKNNGDDLVIIRHYKHDKTSTSSSRKNKPTDFTGFDLYTQETKFFNESINDNLLKQIDEDFISDFFDVDGQKTNLADIFKLFVYIQQEETTFFLKQAETDRKDSLGFLFESTIQEKKNEQLLNQSKIFKQIISNLKNKKKNLTKIKINTPVEYEQLFPWKETKQIDKVYPFQEIDVELLEENKKNLFEILMKLEEFVSSFSPYEFDKMRKDKYFSTYINDEDFCKAFVLEKYISNESFLKTQLEIKSLLKNNDYPIRIFLELAGIDFNKVMQDVETHKLLNKMCQNKDELYKLELDELVEFLVMSGLDNQNIENFIESMNRKKSLEDDLTRLDSKIHDMNKTREELRNKHIHRKEIIEDSTCPFCGYDWQLGEKLEIAYEELTKRLTVDYQELDTSITAITNEINHKFFDLAITQAESKLLTLTTLPDPLIKVIQNNLEKNLNTSTYKQLLMELKDYNVKKGVVLTEEIFNDNVNKIWNELKVQLVESQELISTLESLKNKDYSNQLEFISMNFKEVNLAKFIFPLESHVDMQKVNTMVGELYSYLQELRLKFNYDTVAVQDENDFYEKVFDANKDNFNVLTLEKINQKKSYIEQQFAMTSNIKISKITERISLLEHALADTNEIRQIYKEQIDSYKNDMVRILKAPFYILSGKILQNYQQGMGVYITSLSNGAVRFITDQSSNHDAMHHLSTGQIAVVSIAFTLVSKKCYSAANQIDFIMIDDPIQDMDSLNMHSFIDVLGRNFLLDNQIILSTHSDSNAALIKYKFDRFTKNKNTKFIDVQNQLFDS